VNKAYPTYITILHHQNPFGMLLVGRNWAAGIEYKYGFNGKENDDEIAGNNNALDFGARIYDARLGRWMSVDKYKQFYPCISPYVFCGGNPINFVDADGNVIRDKDGNIVFVPLGSMQVAHPSGSKATVTVGYIFADDGTQIMVYRNEDTEKVGWNTDCHGSSFADGIFWIDNNQVPTILAHDGYAEVDYERRIEGDKVIYADKSNNVVDSRTVTSDINKVKGQGGLEEADYVTGIDDAWDSDNKRIFRKESVDLVYTDEQISNLNTQINNEGTYGLTETSSRTAALPKQVNSKEKYVEEHYSPEKEDHDVSPSQGNDLHYPK